MDSIARVAKVLNESSSNVIDTDDFRAACRTAGVNPDLYTRRDLDRLHEMLK